MKFHCDNGKITSFLLVIVFLLVSFGCSGPSESEKLYNLGFETEVSRGMESAIPVYKEIVARYPSSPEAGLARSKVREFENAQKRIAEQRESEKRRQQEERLRQARELERAKNEKQIIQRLAKEYANKAGEKIMSSSGGGRDLVVKVKRWTYDEYAEEYEIKIEVYWSGSMWRSNKYNVDGILTTNRNGSSSNFSRTYANQTFKDLEDTMMWLGAGVALGALATSN